MRRLLHPAGKWLAKLFRSGARLLRFAVAVARTLLRLTARFGSRVGRFLAPAARAAAVALVGVGWGIWWVGRALAIAVRAVVVMLVRGGRAIWWVARRIGRPLAVVLGAVGRVVRGVAVAIGRVVRAVAVAVGRVVRAMAVAVGRVVRAMAVAVGRALAIAVRAAGLVLVGVGRTARTVAVAVGRVVARVGQGLRAAASALVAVSAPLRRAAAAALKTLARGLLRPVFAVGRTVARSLAPVGRLARGIGREAWDLLGAGGRLCRRAVSRLGVAGVALLRQLSHRFDAWVHAGRLAHGSARRRARRLAHTSAAVPGPVVRTLEAGAPAGTAAAAQPLPRRTRRSTGRLRDGVTFDAAISQNAYLEIGGSVVDAVVTVSTAVARVLDDVTAPRMAEVILLDCSGSMGHPLRKMTAARQATQAAVEALRDGVAFAIVRCAGEAEVVYPDGGGLAVASRRTRDEAKAAAESLEAGGGTAMARWLLQARDLFMTLPDAIHHALLLTDGRDEGETRAELAGAVDACADDYQCDCRGMGTDWDVDELRHVAAGLLGTVDIIPDPSGMEADFRAVTERAMRRVVDTVDLHVRTPSGAHVEYVKQITPSVEELTAYEGSAKSTREYATGAWGREARQYHIRVRVEPQPAGTEMLAARVQVVVGDATCAQAKVLATWTEDPVASGYPDPVVATATGRAELATAIRRGLEARRRGDDTAATALLGRAVQLASETDNRDVGALLAKVVEVHDAPSGTVTLRRHVADVDEMVLDTRSTKTVRTDR